MPLPIAHSLAGTAIYAVASPVGSAPRWKLWLAAMFLANGPDLDFLPGLMVGEPARYHQGFTHSLAAGLVLAAVVWLFAHRSGLEWSALRLAGAVCVLWGSHVVLDSLTVDLGAPFGVPMLWPFSSDHVHLANMFVHAQKTNGRVEVVPWLLSLFSRNNIGGSVLEVVIVAPPAIALWLWRFHGAVSTRSGVEPGVSPRPPRRHSTGSADEG